MVLEKAKKKEEVNLSKPKRIPNYWKGMIQGIGLSGFLVIIAALITLIPVFSIMGIMIISILLGMAWKRYMPVRDYASVGITFSSKYLLRAGIILMGLRLNFEQIINAGISVLVIDTIVIVFTMLTMIYLGKLLKVDRHLSALIASGTAICGAAAIVAVAPLINGKKQYTALAVACIAILGTIGAIIYILIYPFINISPEQYGVLVGATLHELAYVIAAAAPGATESLDIAILTKLGRVALLIPVAIILGMIFKKYRGEENSEKNHLKNLPIPWFILGFLAMSVVTTFKLLPIEIISILIDISVYLLAMGMVGLGLNVNFKDLKEVGSKPFVLGIVGSVLLGAIGPLLILIY